MSLISLIQGKYKVYRVDIGYKSKISLINLMLCNGFAGWQMENIPTRSINFNVIENTMKITESLYNTYY